MNLATALKPLFSIRSIPVNPGTGLSFLRGGVASNAGQIINQDNTLQLSAFFNGVDIISNDLAKLPLGIYQKQKPKGRVKIDHPASYLINTRPNDLMTAFMLKKMLVLHAIFKGNGYARIHRDRNGGPTALELIDQDQHPVQVLTFKGKLYYKVQEELIDAVDMLHLPGFSLNGITGISVISYAAHSIGINLEAQEMASEYYRTKGLGRGVINAATDMDDDAKSRYASEVSDALSTEGNGYKVVVLDEVASFTPIKITAQEADFLKTNKAGVEECARFLNLHLHKLKVLDNVNNSITENLEIGHVKDSIEPWAMKVAQEFTYKLISYQDQAKGVKVIPNLNSLMRTDTKTKAEWYSKAVFSGFMTRNEVRELEELNALDGLDEPLTPVNTQTLTQLEADEKGKE